MGSVPGIPRPTAHAQTLRRTATPAERLLWMQLSNRKPSGYKFSRQMPVGPYVCDFICRSARLVVELDGYSHDLSTEADDARTRFIEAQGLTLLRFVNMDVLGNVEAVCAAILDHLEAGPPPAPPASGRGDA